ncbi:unnamed protein product [Brachionus calyciflorus]|uniref:Band 7 domain-containing protein n=1 Tax=Brachionus calyciflorus TaxID=104777 RepID=A0A813W559_9BILA|nr:unnamed protein product [Brachionus calyciflorus]
MADEKTAKLIGLVASIVLGIGGILLIILLPMSFSYLDFYEYGFVRRRTTGKVYTDNVYSGGRHLIGPDFEFKEFYAAAQFVSFYHIPIFTLDNLEVKITAELQYFLIKEDLKLLHDSYDVYYHQIIANNAKDAIKNSITKFDTDEFISNRSVIQNDLFFGVRQRLSGKCCLPNCKTDCKNCKQWEMCDKNCKPRPLCTKEDKGFFVEVRYLELQDIDIPLQVNERKLLSLIRDLEKEKEESVKEEMIVRKNSEYEVAKITNKAKEIVENAKAQYSLLINQAEVNASRIIENIHNDGLQKMFNDLGLTSPKHKSSLNYIRSLKNHEKIKYSIDFNTLIANTNSK